jgi:hypothetical protein
MSVEKNNVSRDTAHIPKFDGLNFHTWKFGLMLLLRNHELQDIVLDSEKLPAEVTHLLFYSRVTSLFKLKPTCYTADVN